MSAPRFSLPGTCVAFSERKLSWAHLKRCSARIKRAPQGKSALAIDHAQGHTPFHPLMVFPRGQSCKAGLVHLDTKASWHQACGRTQPVLKGQHVKQAQLKYRRQPKFIGWGTARSWKNWPWILGILSCWGARICEIEARPLTGSKIVKMRGARDSPKGRTCSDKPLPRRRISRTTCGGGYKQEDLLRCNHPEWPFHKGAIQMSEIENGS